MTDGVGSPELSEADVPRGVAAIFGPTLNAVLAPTQAFEVLGRHPLLAGWPIFWMIVVMMLLGAVNLDITRQIMRVGVVEGMAGQGQQVDAEQVRTIIDTMDKWAPAWAVGFNLFALLSVVVLAGLIWIGASTMGGVTKFSHSFAVASIGAVIHPLLATAFVTLVWRLEPPEIRRVADFVRSMPSLGLGLFTGDIELSPAMAQVVARVDVFNFWWMAVIVIGCERLLGLKRGAAMAMAIALWVLSTGLMAFWASLGS